MNESMVALVLVIAGLLVVIMLIAVMGKPRLNKHYFTKHWEHIEKDTNLMSSLIKADNLLDEAMKHAHIKGDTMGERLNNAAGILRDINSAWSAHKLRNRAVHESGTVLSHSDVSTALKQFKKALKDLGAL